MINIKNENDDKKKLKNQRRGYVKTFQNSHLIKELSKKYGDYFASDVFIYNKDGTLDGGLSCYIKFKFLNGKLRDGIEYDKIEEVYKDIEKIVKNNEYLLSKNIKVTKIKGSIIKSIYNDPVEYYLYITYSFD